MAYSVLVVDDDVRLQSLLHALLLRAGYATDFACDGKSALVKLREQIYDAILLDLAIPYITGLQILQSLARDNRALIERIIVLSCAAPATLAEAAAFPVHATLRKPFDIVELVRTVNACSKRICT